MNTKTTRTAAPQAATPSPRRLPQARPGRWHGGQAATAMAALLLALASPASQAADAATFASAMALFDQAQSGQGGGAQPSAERWRALSNAEPTDPVLRAYAGAATAMLARDTVLPWKKMSHAEDGLAQIDKALAHISPAHDAPAYRGVPAVLETRFTAASTFLALPGMFNRAERGQRLLEQVLGSPLFEPSPMAFKAAVWLTAGRTAASAGKTDEARQWLGKAAASNQPQAAAAAAARLKAL